MAEKTIKISEEVFTLLNSLRKDNESIESVLKRFLPTTNASISIDDFFGKWIGSAEEIDMILGIIAATWNEWDNTLQT